MDDGSRGEFGKEIELRAQFEACASLPRGEPLERQVADCIRRLEVGWHGSQDGWGDSFDEASLDRPSAAPTDGHSSGEDSGDEGAVEERERTLSICLAFEGGPGTVSTVAAAVRNRTPGLLMYGSGRATDLLCDALRVYESEGGAGARPPPPPPPRPPSLPLPAHEPMRPAPRPPASLSRPELRAGAGGHGTRRAPTASWCPPQIPPRRRGRRRRRFGSTPIGRRLGGIRADSGPGQVRADAGGRRQGTTATASWWTGRRRTPSTSAGCAASSCSAASSS